ncbi:MAG: tRNA lysidine(34) synthetase TilS [Deltaproteobacteria bacterium]|nr:tRNA lysidine(34) synthetase TilS [Deltaproteobacteria bacterium]
MISKRAMARIVELVRGRAREFIGRSDVPAGRILAACSGGGDSTALVDVLLHVLGPDRIGVAYIEHGQHPSSLSAGRLVEKRCDRLGLDFHLTGLDLPPGAGEQTLRQARYRALNRLAQQHGYARLATGHTASDQVETILIRLVRGTGVAGLAGIPLERDGFVIRPLLGCSRFELERYLVARRLRWHRDPTNDEIRYLRNRLRHEVLPALRACNPALDQALLRLARAAARDEAALAAEAEHVRCELDGAQRARAPLAGLRELHAAVQARVVLRLVRLLDGPGASLELSHLERILERIERAESWSADLPGGLRVSIRASCLWMETGKGPEVGFYMRIERDGCFGLPSGNRLRFAPSRFEPSAAGPCKVFFDADEVPYPLEVRSPRDGDRLRPWGIAGRRKVARMLIDAKVPRSQRNGVALLVKDDRILWIAGMRRGDAAPVTSATRRVLCVELLPELDAPSAKT